jgi:Icc-related predicted phosphoesterase
VILPASGDNPSSGTRITVLAAADLHQSRTLYDELEKAVQRHRPDLVAVVGDWLDLDDAGGRELSRAECGRRLNALPCEVVFVRGNHESDGWRAFAEAWRSGRRMRPLNALHCEAYVQGPLVIVGFPCRLGDEFHYLDGRKPSHEDRSNRWLEQVMRRYGGTARTFWLVHEPPAGTKLSEETGPMAGRIEWLATVERYSPLLVVCGHDHRTPRRHGCWHEKVRQTQVVNAGQKLDGPLHYSLIEFEFPQATPGLPTRIKVSAFPWERSIEVLGGEQVSGR